ncbi:stage V sporulation protein T [Lachnoclostridium sp. An169]|uniref:stage V sporulation protein T n=1 Tax=Lachnoclostridium sp. An169 TaxID=1965569 RepID=UPI000B3847D3|nr:stage V sporulation protein T [Lachnoclostridium sp. An169]OUP85658.1 stage V sporulation protein T [Lachnoclostridium sp. An169]
MKATGIVRRIDDLGRVVIPKEIRRTLRIREGDPLEIFTDREGEIILKKYSPIGELGTLAKLYAESLSQTLGCTVCITDMDQVVAASGAGKKELQDQFISKELEKVLQERKMLLEKAGQTGFIKVIPDMTDFMDEAVCPIISEGDVIGGVTILNKDDKKKFGELEQKVAASAADFLGRQMGS